MAIRIRKIKNSGEIFEGRMIYKYIALCAAEHKAEKGDIYLDDAMHHALSDKFWDDHVSMGFIRKELISK